MPLIARQRPRLAVLAVLALVGSLLAISAVPAVAAQDEKASAVAEFSACVEDAIEDAAFTDMEGNFAQDDANCLFHYGITTGTGKDPLTYGPNDRITRRQMALFLERAAGPAGIELGDAEDQGFSDIAGESDAIQNAINLMAGAGIMEGSGSSFDPTGNVNRLDMAVFLDAFLAEAGVVLGRKAPKPYNIVDDDIDTPFPDIYSVPVTAFGAINRLYELGVANGKEDGTFGPDEDLSRAQMAVFITRALAHTNARPAGLSVQVSPATAYRDETPAVQASLRDANHQPISEALVDVFVAQSNVEAFDDEGKCSTDLEDDGLISVGGIRCVIDAADEETESDGNVLVDTDAGDYCPGDGDTILWLWTGDIGDEFNVDDTDFATATLSISGTPRDVTVKSDKPGNARFLKLGDTANFDLQVVDDVGKDVALEGLVLSVRVRELRNGALLRDVVDDHETDAQGRVEITRTHDDPRPGADVSRQGDSASVEVSIDQGEECRRFGLRSDRYADGHGLC